MIFFYLFLLVTNIAYADFFQENFQDFDQYKSPQETKRAITNVQFQNILVKNSTIIQGTLFADSTITASAVILTTPNCATSSLELLGDVIGSTTANTVSIINGQSAAQIAAATILAYTATANNIANSIVKRDSMGNINTESIFADIIETDNDLSSATILTTSLNVSETLDTPYITSNQALISSNLYIEGNLFYKNIQVIFTSGNAPITISPSTFQVIVRTFSSINNCNIFMPPVNADLDGKVVTITFSNSAPLGTITYFPGTGITMTNAVTSFNNSIRPSATYMYVHSLASWVLLRT